MPHKRSAHEAQNVSVLPIMHATIKIIGAFIPKNGVLSFFGASVFAVSTILKSVSLLENRVKNRFCERAFLKGLSSAVLLKKNFPKKSENAAMQKTGVKHAKTGEPVLSESFKKIVPKSASAHESL